MQQKTSKQFKLQIAVSSIGFWIGFVWLVFWFFDDYNDVPYFVITLILLSVILHIGVKATIWWRYK